MKLFVQLAVLAAFAAPVLAQADAVSQPAQIVAKKKKDKKKKKHTEAAPAPEAAPADAAPAPEAGK